MELIPKIGIFEIMLKPLVEGYAFILRGSPIFEKSKYVNRDHTSSTNYRKKLELNSLYALDTSMYPWNRSSKWFDLDNGSLRNLWKVDFY